MEACMAPDFSGPLDIGDATNVAILEALSADPRISTAELARKIGMSGPAVRERVSRLEETGVIRGYRVDINPRALGYAVTAFVRVRPMLGQLPKLIKLAQETPEVIECHRITGEDCFMMKLCIRSIDTLDTVLDAFLAYGQTTTSIIQSSPVALRTPPVCGPK
jgi:Lrp/AsnC family transcriptional regulator, leucine-responsive regulatory protein